jgi:D-alanyl-D-alanine carboxypeptidase
MRDTPMTSSRPGDLLFNGLAHALLVTRDHRGRARNAWLLRKADQKTLASVMLGRRKSVVPGDRRRLSRTALKDLQALLDYSQLDDRTAVPAPSGQPEHIERLMRQLGIDENDLAGYRPPRSAEPGRLLMVGHDLYGRPFWLEPASARAWRRMQESADAAGVTLCAVSGYRSADYQATLIARKLANGQSLAAILRVSALPGHSEHHLGTTLDLHDGTGPALEESFEETAAFDWLRGNASAFGFVLSYPRDNSWGISYEPWHWRYVGTRAG